MAADLAPSVDRVDDKPSKIKPEKPDEEKYKADLAKAEKEHAAVQERLVRLPLRQTMQQPEMLKCSAGAGARSLH